MAIRIKSLRDAQLVTGGTTTLQYPDPADKSAVVRNIRLVSFNDASNSTVPATVTVECKGATGTLSKAVPKPLTIAPHARVLVDEEFTLGIGDYIKITLEPPAAGMAKLDVVISGMERTV